MKAHIPRTFRTGAIVDSEDVNANLQAISRSIARNVGQRYTYCSVSVDISGIINTDTAAERTIPFFLPDVVADLCLNIVGVEVSIYATAGATWTLTATDENGTVFTLATATAGTTTEGYNASNVPLQITSAALNQRLDFVLSASAGSTITRGTVTIHVRADRNLQGAGIVPASYLPTLIDASTSTAATAINAETTAANAARVLDAANQMDLRGCCLVANDLASAQIWRLPSGAGYVALSRNVGAVGVAARSVDVAITGSSTTNVPTTGTSAIETATDILPNKSDDPTNTAGDLVVTLTPTGGVISRVFVFLWWS
jgi:hypothetical protein